MNPKKLTHHGWELPKRETLLTIPSLVTLIRTVGALAFALIAIAERTESPLYIALAIYWIGDIADGFLARRLKQEMRAGAVLDIVTDRLCVAVIYVGFLSFHADFVLPVAVYLLQFMMLDTVLSLAFLHWPLLSPNYFFLVDKFIYKYNWSIPAKVFNSAVFILVTIILQQVWLSLLVATINTAIKIISLRRLYDVVLPKQQAT